MTRDSFEILSAFLNDGDFERMDKALTCLGPKSLALAFVRGGFAAVAIGGLAEQLWLRSREDASLRGEFEAFVDVASVRELASLKPILPHLRGLDGAQLREREERADAFAFAAATRSRSHKPADFQVFLESCVAGMAELLHSLAVVSPEMEAADRAHVARLRAGGIKPVWPDARPLPHEGRIECSLYRAFDAFDVALGIDYTEEKRAQFSTTRERLYEGAGAGVQTSYATILQVLDRLDLAPGARLADLGSGYGRVGLALGLARRDVSFVGYEYVAKRIECSRECARRAGLGDRIEFHAQDLADPQFEIPEADVYYLYDPFCRETYPRVLQRILDVARTRPVAVVAKGNANNWMRDATAGDGWTESIAEHDHGVGIFRSSVAPDAVLTPHSI